MASSKAGLRRAATWTTVGVVVIGTGWWMSRPSAVPVDVAEVTRGDLRVTLDQEGTTRARHHYVISAPVTGRVQRISLEPGDRVLAGRTEIATLVPEAAPFLDARSRATAEARLKSAKALADQARAALAQAETLRDQAERERARTAHLFDGKAVSQSALEVAETEAHARSDAADAARAAVATAQHDVDVAAASLAAPAPGEPRGGRLVLHAPVDGVVLKRLQESESVVAAGTPLVEVADVGDLEIVADYLSTDAVKIRPDMPAEVDRWGGSAPLKGHVRRIEPGAFVKVSALGVEEQRVNVVVDIDDPREAWASLGDGYRVEVRVIVWQQASVLQVPSSALFRQGDAWAAFVIEDGRARLRRVEIGQQTGLATELRSGLAEHDRVLVHPSDKVAEGVQVTPRT
jgi:HlyD family secretion protein